MPHTTSRAKTTMRISVELESKPLSYIMRTRKKKTAAETLRILIDEEAERLKSWKTHKEIEGKIPRAQFDDRAL